MSKKDDKPGYIGSLLQHKCARCRKGDMFQTRSSYDLKRFMKMNTYCPVCNQPMEIEVGFYYGTSYVSYAVTVAISVTSFVAWWVLIGLSVHDNRFFWWLGINITMLILLQPYLQRLSRAIWLSFFVRYNPNWHMEKPDTAKRG